MPTYETFRANAAEAPIIRRWIVVALVVSLAIHGSIFMLFYRQNIGAFEPEERLAPPRAFNLKRVSLPPLQEELDTKTKLPDKLPTPSSITIADEKPAMEEIHVAPQMTDLSKQITNEKPKVDPAGSDLAKAEAGSRAALEKELNAVTTALLKEGPASPHQPIIAVSGGKAGSGNGDANLNIPGLKSLDEALAQTGPLPAGDKPIGMQGGALFEYDSFDLRPESVDALQKLATLIQRNPNANFSIEGHTDSFGNPEYNQRLSEKRAESVKIWLTEVMRISPDRIQTRGYGNTKPIVPSDRSREEQAPNRRVEIVVKTARSR